MTYEWLAIDTESSGADVHQGATFLALSWCTPLLETGYWDVREKGPLLALPSASYYVVHNAKYEFAVFNSLPHIPFDPATTEDTLLAIFVLNPAEPSRGLKELSMKYLNDLSWNDWKLTKWQKAEKKRTGKALNWADIPIELLRPYAMHDALCTAKLWQKFSPVLALDKRRHAVYRNEVMLADILAKVEHRGIQVNIPFAAEQINICKEKEEQIKRLYSPANLGSPVQLRRILAAQGIQLTQKTQTGLLSTDEMALKHAMLVAPDEEAKKVLADVLLYRAAVKQRRTYYEAFINHSAYDGAIHPSFNQVGQPDERGVVTGRFSSSKPNLQNVPR